MSKSSGGERCGNVLPVLLQALAFQQVNWISRKMNTPSLFFVKAVPYNDARNF
jgi:hypothetical protein